MNKTLMENVLCMLSNSDLSKSFCAEAANMTCFLVNRSHSLAINKKTPKELWSSTIVNYSDLKFFECPTFLHLDNKKLELRYKWRLFLTYEFGVKGYKLWDPEVSKIVISGDVIFDEIAMLRDSFAKETNTTGH